jgi:hypothetical protein
MTIFKMWQEAHKYCKDATVTVQTGENMECDIIVFHCPTHEVNVVERAPYPFCHTPVDCAGNGYCNRNPACNN